MPSFNELLKVLGDFCENLDVNDLVSYEAATTFGAICVKNSLAVEKMLTFLYSSSDTHKKALVSHDVTYVVVSLYASAAV